MSSEPLSILISGAGVAGTSLALMLARQPNFKLKPKIILVERSPVPRTTGQSVDLRGPAVDLIRRVGLEPEIKARHTTETGLAFLDAKGSIVATFNATGDVKKQSATSEYEILRGDLAGLLLDGVNEAKEKGAQVNIVYGESVESLEERSDGNGVDVQFANGKLDHQRFDVVIGADGIASRTRALIFGEADYRKHVHPSGMYLGFFSIPRVPEDDGLWRWCSLPGGMAMHLRPHRNGKTMGAYLTLTNTKPERHPELEPILHADVASQKKYLRQRFQSAGGWQKDRFLEGLENSDDFYMTHWCQVTMPQWIKGHGVIIGDAAFATMGIGTSLAMIGAYCLAGELSKMDSASQVPDALRRYEEVFRPYVKKHETQKPGMVLLANPHSKWGVWLFQTILRLLAVLRIPQIIMKFFGDGSGSESWKLPEYGW